MQQVNYLRTFAYTEADLGFGEVNTEQMFGQQPLTLGQYYYLFHNDLAGVYCGGAAQFLNLLYQHFGFESCIYDMGGNNGNSHMSTLVKVNGKWYVRDAFYHITYLYAPDSTELDFCKLLHLLQQHKHDSVAVWQNPVLPNTGFLFSSDSVRRFLETKYNYCQVFDLMGVSPQMYYNPNAPAKVKVVFPRSILLLTHIDGDNFARFLQEHQMPPYFVYLFLFPKKQLHEVNCPS